MTSLRFYLQVWETKSRCKLFRPISLHQSWVTDVQWSKDGLKIVSVGDKMAWSVFFSEMISDFAVFTAKKKVRILICKNIYRWRFKKFIYWLLVIGTLTFCIKLLSTAIVTNDIY